MRKRLALPEILVLVLVLGTQAACGGGSGPPAAGSPPGQSPPSSAPLTGTWQGTWSGGPLGGALSASFTQTANSLTGNVTVSNSACHSTGTVTGTVNGSNILIGSAFPGNQSVNYAGTLNAAQTTITGTFTVIGGLCTGSAGTWALTKTSGIVPPPGFTLSASAGSISVPQGGASSVTVSVTGTSGFTGSVGISIQGLPQGVTTSPALPFSISAGSSQQVTFSVATSVSASNFSLTVSGTSGSLAASQALNLSVQSFSISVSPSTSQTSPVSITMNSPGTSLSVTVNAVNGFSGNINLSVTGLPNGVSVNPSSWIASTGQSQQVVISANVSAAVASFQTNVTGSSGAVSNSSVTFGQVILPPNSAVIGQAGGTLTISDPSSPLFGMSIDVPPNALSQPILIQASTVSSASLSSFPTNVAFSGIGVELLPSGLQFASPATLSLPIPDTNRDGVVDGSNVPLTALIPGLYDSRAQRFSLLESFTDPLRRAVVAEISHFSSILTLIGRFPSNRVVTYTFGILPTNLTGSEAELRAAIVRALNTWTTELRRSGISFAPAAPGSTSDITFTSVDSPMNPTRHAFTGITFSPTGIVGLPVCWGGTCEIAFNNTSAVSTATGFTPALWTGNPADIVGTIQIETIALHEIGHALGLGHSCQNCRATSCPRAGTTDVFDIMARFMDQTCPVRVLSRRDVTACRRNYGLLYAESIVGLGSGPSVLYTVDPVSGGVDMPVGLITLANGSTPVITDLAQNSHGDLFGISFDSLFRVDILTGRAQLVGLLGSNGFNALAFDRQDNLFAASTSGDFVRIDTTTGTATRVGSYGFGFVSSGDLVFVPAGPASGELYGTGLRSSDVSDQLLRIDVGSGQGSRVMDLGRLHVFGFVWAAPSVSGPWTPCFMPSLCIPGQFWGLTTDVSTTTSTGELFLVNPGIGSRVFVRRLSFNAGGGAVPNL